jgi:hypothetical protein
MSKAAGALAGAIVVIAMLVLLFAVRVASRYAPPPMERHATGPKDACRSNSDCWCAGFDGAEFIPGQFSQSTCQQNGTCALCLYE